jgi:hypothetical protein
MVIPAKHRRSFYQMVAGNVLRPGRMVPKREHTDGGYTGLTQVESRCALLSLAALDMGLGMSVVREWLIEAATAHLDMQERTGRSTGFKALRTVFRLGTCHDAAVLTRWGEGYLRTPHGSDRNQANSAPGNHYWHFAHVLAAHHAGDRDHLERSLADLREFGPCKGWTHSADWFDAMRALALEALTATKPSIDNELAAVAEINQSMFAPRDNDGFYEAWFAELAMSFVPAALQRGWRVEGDGPHVSVPLGLFVLPPREVAVRPWSELASLAPDDELAAAIKKAASRPAGKRAKKAAGKREKS